MAISPSMIPYERQADDRMCGAAALNMVYRSLKIPSSQADVWPHVARPNALGENCAHTHLLASDARRRGLGAVILEARRPLDALDWCGQDELRVILNHRSNPTTWRGHYSVLAAVDAANVVLHDPQFGPCRTETREAFAWLWQPDLHPANEISGNVLIALAPETGTRWNCPDCDQETTESLRCNGCGAEVRLRPARALGCTRMECERRIWRRVFCPSCDAVVLEAPADELAGGSPFDLARFRSQLGIDRFEAVFVTMPRLLKWAVERAAPDRKPALAAVAAERERLIDQLKSLLEPAAEDGRKYVDELTAEIGRLKGSLDDVLKNPRPKRTNSVRAAESRQRAKYRRAESSR